MDEKKLLQKSGIFILFLMSLYWLLFLQSCNAGYTGGSASGIDVGINSRNTAQVNWQVGSSGVYTIRLGIENIIGSGSVGYMTGTNTYYPRIEWTPTLGTFNFVGTGSYPVTVQMNGVAIPSSGSVNGKIDAVAGTGTTNTLTDTTLAGQGTITASFGANGLVISPAEYASVNNATSELQAQINTKQNSIGQTPLGSSVGSVTSAMGSQSINALNDCNITFNENDYVKIVGGQLVSGSSSASVAFSDVTGSATALQLPITHQGTTTAAANYLVKGDSSGKITNWLSSGAIVGRAYGSNSTYSNLVASNCVIPFDNTIPQSSEGTLIVSLGYTPGSTTTRIRVFGAAVIGANDTNARTTTALFLNSETDARTAAPGCNVTTGDPNPTWSTPVMYDYIPGTTTTQTWYMRGGGSVSSGNVFLINGAGHNLQIYGGCVISHLTIEEYIP